MHSSVGAASTTDAMPRILQKMLLLESMFPHVISETSKKRASTGKLEELQVNQVKMQEDIQELKVSIKWRNDVQRG